MCKTIKQKVKFKAPPERVYDVLADSKLRSKVTGRKAEIGRKVGAPFTSDNGRVSGVNVDLVPGKRLVQAWRRDDYPEGVYSMAAITLAKTSDGGTELVLTHRGVPKWLLDATEEEWKQVYWTRMKEWFSHNFAMQSALMHTTPADGRARGMGNRTAAGAARPRRTRHDTP